MPEVITQNYAKSVFKYNPETGILYWQWSRSGSKAGARAGTVELRGPKGYKKRYVVVGLDGKTYLAHRMIWLMVHGVHPNEIDHQDGDGLNNRLANLRNVKHRENQKNKRLYSSNKTGTPGVNKTKATGNWQARITVNGKRIILGTYEEKADAVMARKRAEGKYKFHKNHGTDRPL